MLESSIDKDRPKVKSRSLEDREKSNLFKSRQHINSKGLMYCTLFIGAFCWQHGTWSPFLPPKQVPFCCGVETIYSHQPLQDWPSEAIAGDRRTVGNGKGKYEGLYFRAWRWTHHRSPGTANSCVLVLPRVLSGSFIVVKCEKSLDRQTFSICILSSLSEQFEKDFFFHF